MNDFGHYLLPALRIVGGTFIVCSLAFWLNYLVSSAERRVALMAAWKRFGHGIGIFISRVLMSIFYIFVLTFVAIIRKATKDDLWMKKKYTWIARKTRDLTLDDAKKQA